jgi:hypothetical protein
VYPGFKSDEERQAIEIKEAIKILGITKQSLFEEYRLTQRKTENIAKCLVPVLIAKRIVARTAPIFGVQFMLSNGDSPPRTSLRLTCAARLAPNTRLG